MFSVHQHWDPLKTCIVGSSYPPKFYDYIKNDKIKKVFYRIAEETEEDYQTLIAKLKSFGVEIFRTEIDPDFSVYFNGHSFLPPPMTPRDHTAMIGNVWFTAEDSHFKNHWEVVRGSDWPDLPKNKLEFDALPDFIKEECTNEFGIHSFNDLIMNNGLEQINNFIQYQGNKLKKGTFINSAMCSRVGKDLYFGTDENDRNKNLKVLKHKYSQLFPNYRCHIVDSEGHADSVYCPVVPGLIMSIVDMPSYQDTFPGWEVVYIKNESWNKVKPFLTLKQKNQGKWWVPGEELNDDFTNYVESWMNHWVGYVEETVFDINMLVIDKKNVICNNYNKLVFDTFSRYGITPHIVNFRHRYFWDGGLHCITSDVHREGIREDFFPERG